MEAALHDIMDSIRVLLLEASTRHDVRAAMIIQEIKTMSTSLSGQMDAATQAVQTQLTRLTTDVGAVSAEVTKLESDLAAAIAGLPVGSTINQGQVYALTKISTDLGAQADALEAVSATTQPPPPAPTPAPTGGP